jgi:superfamily II DNA or RNA helicase
MSYFNENSIELRALTSPNSGLRPGQLGAIHSVLAHFSVHDEPALVSLPTGYVKTAVTMSLPFVLKAHRVLVVVPSDALRKQTTSHFKELSTLRKLSLVPEEMTNPTVVGQEGRVVGIQGWSQLELCDVVISTPHSISPEVVEQLRDDFFDLVVVDEAHHLPARTWNSLIEYYSKAKCVLLTGTPFRRDRKIIQGKLAYWYPVSKASEENAFGRVSFKPVMVQNDDDDEAIDQAIVSNAVSQLREDERDGYDHRIFARAASITAAKKLLPLYEAAGVNVKSITSHIAKRTQEKIEADLISGDLDGVICVDMFGEAFQRRRKYSRPYRRSCP